MPEVSDENRQLARYLSGLFDRRPDVRAYYDDARHSRIDVMSAIDIPTPNVWTYATLGLSDHDIGMTAEGVPLGVEILMAARDYFTELPNIVSTCAFNVINSGMLPRPGAIFPRVIELYRPDARLTHVFFHDPFLWPVVTQRFATKVVAWLMGVPISEGERLYALAHGSEALSSLFGRHEIDIFDLDRPAVA